MALAEAHYETLLIEQHDRVARITLNRPEVRNAISSVLQAELVDAVERCAADATVHCIVVRGAGPSFCSGYDIGSTTVARGREPLAPGAGHGHAGDLAGLVEDLERPAPGDRPDPRALPGRRHGPGTALRSHRGGRGRHHRLPGIADGRVAPHQHVALQRGAAVGEAVAVHRRHVHRKVRRRHRLRPRGGARRRTRRPRAAARARASPPWAGRSSPSTNSC